VSLQLQLYDPPVLCVFNTALLVVSADDAASQGHVIKVVKATLSSEGFYERFGFQVVARQADVKRGVEILHILMRRGIPADER
jgi:hypothetical protein